MFTADLISTLSQLPGPLLTVYLNTSTNTKKSATPALPPPYLTWLKTEAKNLADQVPAEEQACFWEQVERVESALSKAVPPHGGIAMFAGPALWRQIPLQSAVENGLHWGNAAVLPLVAFLGRYQPACILVVDRARARFFRYWLGQMTELEEVKFVSNPSAWKKKDLGHVEFPGSRKTRGSQRDLFDHRQEAQYQRWYRQLGEQVKLRCKKEDFPWIFLVGSKRQTEDIRKNLPSPLRERASLVAEDLGGMWDNVIRRHLLPYIEKRAADENQQHVTALLNSASGSVLGIDEALFEMQAGRISRLLLAEGFDPIVRRCAKCGLVAQSADPLCTACGSERHPARLSDVLPAIAAIQGTHVEVASGEAGGRLIRNGGIGGWLRQKKLAAHG